MLINTFFYSLFNHCPLKWMFFTDAMNNKIEKLHKQSLQMIKSDFTATYENLFAIDESTTICKPSLQFVITRNL